MTDAEGVDVRETACRGVGWRGARSMTMRQMDPARNRPEDAAVRMKSNTSARRGTTRGCFQPEPARTRTHSRAAPFARSACGARVFRPKVGKRIVQGLRSVETARPSGSDRASAAEPGIARADGLAIITAHSNSLCNASSFRERARSLSSGSSGAMCLMTCVHADVRADRREVTCRMR